MTNLKTNTESAKLLLSLENNESLTYGSNLDCKFEPTILRGYTSPHNYHHRTTTQEHHVCCIFGQLLKHTSMTQLHSAKISITLTS